MTALLCKLFVKNHREVTDPRVRAAYGTMVSIVGIVLNLLLFGAKFLVGSLFGAVSIVADAVNNLSDAVSALVALIGFRLAERPAEHPAKHPAEHPVEHLAERPVEHLAEHPVVRPVVPVVPAGTRSTGMPRISATP